MVEAPIFPALSFNGLTERDVYGLPIFTHPFRFELPDGLAGLILLRIAANSSRRSAGMTIATGFPIISCAE